MDRKCQFKVGVRACLLIFLCTFLLFSFELAASIQFRPISVDSAISKAKIEDKLVFIDAYAIWCAPCKEMDKVFEQPEVAQYFNTHYINIKIDMDGLHGRTLLNQYGVVWLPTMLILNRKGDIVSRIDRRVNGPELIRLAKEASSQRQIQLESVLNRTPFSSSQSPVIDHDSDPNDHESIVYIHDENVSSGRPEIMYHEAYLHLQLNDGKHPALVQKYLSTQEDWSTEKNVKFIFDFMNSITSELFIYCIHHKARFEEVIGAERVKESISFLVHQHLIHAFPQPDLEEVSKLFTYIQPSTAEDRAYLYYLDQLRKADKDQEYITVGLDYLNHVNPNNYLLSYDIVTYCLKNADHIKYLQQCEKLMTDAIEAEDDQPKYEAALARVFFLKNDKKNALLHISKSITLAKHRDEDLTSYQELYDQIQAL